MAADFTAKTDPARPLLACASCGVRDPARPEPTARSLHDLPPELLSNEPQARPEVVDSEVGTFQEMKARRIAAMEQAYVEGLLKKHTGNVTHCSEEAGMARSAFQKLMQKYAIRSADYRG